MTVPRGAIFDLDGTLVETESLKARSYAEAVAELSGGTVPAGAVENAYRALVGRSRDVVASTLMEEFSLERAARSRMAGLGEESPADALIALRLRRYERLLADDALIRSRARAPVVTLLRHVRRRGLRTALVTVSHRDQVDRILRVLGLASLFDATFAREDVQRAKPDPEVYERALAALRLSGPQCIALEDSPAGIRAALAANVTCLAVPNDFTREAVDTSGLLPAAWIAADDAAVATAAARFDHDD